MLGYNAPRCGLQCLPPLSFAAQHPFMNILALDTSTEFCSAALRAGDQVIERGTAAGQSHSTLLLGMIDSLLAESGLQYSALDGIAYGEGPGAFTGLRIACAVVQGIAFAHDLPVCGIGTLRALAARSGAEQVIACLDARMGEVYHGAYLCSGGEWREVSAPRVCPPAMVPLPEGAGWAGCGSGFAAHGEILRGRLGAALQSSDTTLMPHAREIAMLAMPEFAAGSGRAAEFAIPVYVRDKVALKTGER